MRIPTHTNSAKTKLLIGVLAGVLVLAGGAGAYFYLHRHDNDIKRNPQGISVEQTPQDKKLAEELNSDPSKKQQATQTDTPPAPTVDKSTNLQQVNVILTNTGESNGMVSASGFVSNVVESSGTCTYVFTNGQKSIEKTSTTLPNSTSTTCKTVQFNASELSAGTWKVQLKYASPTSAGTSNTLEVTVS